MDDKDWERDGRADKVWKLVRYLRDDLGMTFEQVADLTDDQWAVAADAISAKGKKNYRNPSPQTRAQVIRIMTPAL